MIDCPHLETEHREEGTTWYCKLTGKAEPDCDKCPDAKTRPLIGRLVKRGRAKFKTAFGDELIEM